MLQAPVPMVISSDIGREHIGIPGVRMGSHGAARIPTLSLSPAPEGMSLWWHKLWGGEVLSQVIAGCHKMAGMF